MLGGERVLEAWSHNWRFATDRNRMATDRIRRSRGGENYLEDFGREEETKEKEQRTSGMVRTNQFNPGSDEEVVKRLDTGKFNRAMRVE